MMAEASVLPSYRSNLIKVHPIGTHLPKDLDTAITIIAILVCILGLIGNSIILWFLSCSTVKKTKISTYFLNITIANIFLVIFCLFYHSKIFIRYFKPVDINMAISRLLVMLHLLGYNTNFYIFTAVCVARCLLVFVPAWKQHHRLDNFTVISCIILWVFSSLVSLVDNFSCYPTHQSRIHEFLFHCRASSLFKIIFELLILLPIMICCALALFVRMQKKAPQTPPAGVDISIIATALLFLLLDSPIRAGHDVLPWNHTIDTNVLVRMFMFFESISNSMFPFVYFFIGVWKRQAGEPLFMCLERALMDEGNMRETTETGGEYSDSEGEQEHVYNT